MMEADEKRIQRMLCASAGYQEAFMNAREGLNSLRGEIQRSLAVAARIDSN
jgi:hypothetical protein